MGVIKIFERGGEDYREYKRALKMAKKSIETLCKLTEDMEDEYGYEERSGYSERDGHDELIEKDGKVYKRMR